MLFSCKYAYKTRFFPPFSFIVTIKGYSRPTLHSALMIPYSPPLVNSPANLQSKCSIIAHINDTFHSKQKQKRSFLLYFVQIQSIQADKLCLYTRFPFVLIVCKSKNKHIAIILIIVVRTQKAPLLFPHFSIDKRIFLLYNTPIKHLLL